MEIPILWSCRRLRLDVNLRKAEMFMKRGKVSIKITSLSYKTHWVWVGHFSCNHQALGYICLGYKHESLLSSKREGRDHCILYHDSNLKFISNVISLQLHSYFMWCYQLCDIIQWLGCGRDECPVEDCMVID